MKPKNPKNTKTAKRILNLADIPPARPLQTDANYQHMADKIAEQLEDPRFSEAVKSLIRFNIENIYQETQVDRCTPWVIRKILPDALKLADRLGIGISASWSYPDETLSNEGGMATFSYQRILSVSRSYKGYRGIETENGKELQPIQEEPNSPPKD